MVRGGRDAAGNQRPALTGFTPLPDEENARTSENGGRIAEEAINTTFALYRRNFIPLFDGVAEIFLRPRKIPL